MGSFKEIKTYSNTGLRLLELTDRGETFYVMFLDKAIIDKTSDSGNTLYEFINGNQAMRYFVTKTGKIEIKRKVYTGQKDLAEENFDYVNGILANVYQYKDKFQRGFKRKGSGDPTPDEGIFKQIFDFLNGMKVLVGRPKEKQLYLLTLDKDVTRLNKERYNEFATQLRDKFGFSYRGGSFQKWSEKEYDADYWHEMGDLLTQYFTQEDWTSKKNGEERKEDSTPNEEYTPPTESEIKEQIEGLELIVQFSENQAEIDEASDLIEALKLLL
jgi:hypothetical protein